jgi:hypothetical protein
LKCSYLLSNYQKYFITGNILDTGSNRIPDAGINIYNTAIPNKMSVGDDSISKIRILSSYTPYSFVLKRNNLEKQRLNHRRHFWFAIVSTRRFLVNGVRDKT